VTAATVTQPTDTDTQCPTHTWCTVNHTDPHEGDDYHYSEITETATIAHALEILASGEPVITLHATIDTAYLDLNELGALIAALAGRWAELAALQAQLTLAGAR